MSHGPTSQYSGSSATLCRLHGWKPGTLLREEHPELLDKPLMLRISAIGEQHVLACDPRDWENESIWNLTCRDWRECSHKEKSQFYTFFEEILETNDPTKVRL